MRRKSFRIEHVLAITGPQILHIVLLLIFLYSPKESFTVVSQGFINYYHKQANSEMGLQIIYCKATRKKHIAHETPQTQREKI